MPRRFPSIFWLVALGIFGLGSFAAYRLGQLNPLTQQNQAPAETAAQGSTATNTTVPTLRATKTALPSLTPTASLTETTVPSATPSLVPTTTETATPEPTATPPPTATARPPTATALPRPSPLPPQTRSNTVVLSGGGECAIKGNISYTTGEKIYHLPGMRFYDDTVIDTSAGERWFCTEAEAVSAGWRRSKR